MSAKKIRTLIVDDSATAREALKALLECAPDIEVFGTARDPYDAVEQIARQVPDVIVLDLEMPRMNGLSFLDTIMQQHPIPVVICSGATQTSAALVFEALARGAVEVVHKPRLDNQAALEESSQRICEAVRAAACARLSRRAPPRASLAARSSRLPEQREALRQAPQPVRSKAGRELLSAKPGSLRAAPASQPVVVVGASTGGTEALLALLQAMPAQAPAIVIVQHMPERFTRLFAERLNRLCAIEVKEAESGDQVLPGRALIAPGNLHSVLARGTPRYSVLLRDGPLVSRHRPSVNVLFRSAARAAGSNAIGVIMTGMGDDGAVGLLELKAAGAWTIAQDEASCVVFGMPNEAIKLGAVQEVLSLPQIAPSVLRRCRR